MILTDKNTITNRYIRYKIGKYKKKKADMIASGKPIRGVKIRRWIHLFLIKLLHIKSILSGLTYEFITDKPFKKACNLFTNANIIRINGADGRI